MPKDIKINIISKNLHRLAQLEQVLFAFGIIMCTVTGIRFHDDFKNHIKEFYYYSGYIITSVHVLVIALKTVKHPDWAIWRQNRPTYTAIFELLVLCVIALFLGSNPLRMFTIYTNICIIAIVLFAVEPIFLLSNLLFFSSILIYSLYKESDIYMIANIILTTFIISGLSLYKWNSLIIQFSLEKVRDHHIENMEKEINLAAFVQESFTKKKLPDFTNYQISYYSKAMAGVSGDMYDFYTNGNNLSGIGIFDVSGHGIASGLVTMLVRNIFQQEFSQNSEKKLEEVVSIIDKRIKKEKGDIENYLTGILLRIKDKKIEIVNAGHPNPILYRKKENTCYFFDKERLYSSSAIGLTALDVSFNSTVFNMEKDDELILYTDGVKEALNDERKEFGSENLFQAVQEAVKNDFGEQINYILNKINLFTQNSAPSDDITIVVLKKL